MDSNACVAICPASVISGTAKKTDVSFERIPAVPADPALRAFNAPATQIDTTIETNPNLSHKT